MRYANLGRSGLKVSRVGLGTWLTIGSALDLERSKAIVAAAIEAGCILFDTADVYAKGGGERALGECLAPFRRRDVVISSKVFGRMSGNPNDRGLSRKHVLESCDQSLKNLGTDYLDIYQCHRFDNETPLEEVVDAMTHLVRQGKILYWGTSEWTARQLAEVSKVAEKRRHYRPICNQPQYNLLEPSAEHEVIPRCRELGISQIAFSPLAQGLLTGKYADGAIPDGSRAADAERGAFLAKRMTSENIDRATRLTALAADLGLTPAQLAIAWCLRHDNVASVLVGATRAEQVSETMAAGDKTLTEEGIQAIQRILDDEFLS